MTSRSRSCKNHPDSFCYIRGEFEITDERNRVADFIQKAYHAYFGVQDKLGNQDKPWAPHVVCKTSVEHLREWTGGSPKPLKFGVPIIRREPKNHTNDCYFCAINLIVINKKKRKSLIYPNLSSALRAVAHCDEIPITVFKELANVPNENLDVSFEEQDDLNDSDFVPKSSEPNLFNQEELSDLIRDLNLSKESSVLLVSRNLLQQGTKITFFRTRDDEFLRFFEELPDFVFHIDIPGLRLKLSVNEYKPEEWRLFIDSSK